MSIHKYYHLAQAILCGTDSEPEVDEEVIQKKMRALLEVFLPSGVSLDDVLGDSEKTEPLSIGEQHKILDRTEHTISESLRECGEKMPQHPDYQHPAYDKKNYN